MTNDTEKTLRVKRCSTCKERLPVSEFQKKCDTKDGLRFQCKTCCKKVQYRHRATPEYQRWREEYNSRPDIQKKVQQQSSDSYYRNRDRRRRQQQARRSSIKGQAGEQLRAEVRAGRIQKPESCEVCARKARLDGHHFDYRLPLEVLWTCKKCHARIHGGMATYARATGRNVT